MSEETDNQRPPETSLAPDRPRRPRRRFHRRYDGPRNRGPEEPQRGDLNGPADRIDSENDRAAVSADRQDGDRDHQQRPDQDPSQNGEANYEPEFGDGIIEISGKGFGFLRDAKRNFVQTPQDIFVTPEIVRRFGLRDGMWIHGETRRGNRGPQLTRLLKINDEEPTKYQGLRPFEELTTINPNRRIKLETVPDRYTTRIMDLMTPLGMGQRGLIVAPPRTGKTTLLQHIADAVVKNHPEMKLIILLVDERPEEVTEIRRTVPSAEMMASSNDSDIKSHTRIAQLAIERAKRLVEAGKDVFILLDSITRTARAFNNAISGGGRTMSGGIDARAMETPRRLFSAARNTEEAGSLTIVATALIETGSRMDELIFQEFKGTGNMELVLDRKISDQRIYPAVDIFLSGTRREELLLQAWELDKINMIRRGLAGHKPGEAIERLLMFVKKFPTNTQMLKEIPG
jgi:transcription termination factor Rho